MAGIILRDNDYLKKIILKLIGVIIKLDIAILVITVIVLLRNWYRFWREK